MPQPTITSAVFVGNNAQPNGQGVMPWANLGDFASWFPQDYNVDGTNRQVGIAPLPFRGRGAYISDDFGSKSIVIPSKYFEGPGVALGAAKAQLSQAGEQYLTLDGKVTGALVKLKGFGTPRRLRKFQPYWWDLPGLEFVMKEPFFQDLLPTGSLNGETFQSSFEAAAQPANIQTLFRSLGTDATGTLNAWTTDAGAPTITANVVTVPINAALRAGHPDLTDLTFQQRFLFATGTQPSVRFRVRDANNYYVAIASATTLSIWKVVGGVFTQISTTAVIALVNATQYWFQVVLAGTSLTVKVFADNAGAINLGSQNGATATIADSTFTSGQIGLFSNSGSSTFGGAFASVCTVTGPGPNGWSVGVTAGEPAFCWSQSNPFSGSRSLSIFNGHSTGNGYWIGGPAPAIGTTVTLAGKVKLLTGSATTGNGASLVHGSDGIPRTACPAADSAWHAVTATGTFVAVNSFLFEYAVGPGTAYCDDFVVSRQVSSVAGVPYYLQPAVDQVPLAGSVSPGTTTSWVFPYAGSVRTNPLLLVNIPVGNTVVINQLILANTMTGETLTITFGPPLAANTAWTITIDCAAFTVTDNLGNSHDFTGSFPMLYGPAGQSNAWTATLITASGTSTGVTLDSKWFSRWEV